MVVEKNCEGEKIEICQTLSQFDRIKRQLLLTSSRVKNFEVCNLYAIGNTFLFHVMCNF